MRGVRGGAGKGERGRGGEERGRKKGGGRERKGERGREGGRDLDKEVHASLEHKRNL